MGGIFTKVTDAIGLTDSDAGENAATAATQAANIQAQAQREQLSYLKEINKLPQQFRESALTKLGGLYGLKGGKGTQKQLIDLAVKSPLFRSIIGSQEAGEEAIMRQASATGGLRSGNVQHALYDYNTQLRNKALLEAYNQQLQGLTGLAGLQTNEQSIANVMGQIGQTQAQGITAAAQAQQAGAQANTSNLLGLGNLGVSIAGLFSDRTLKKDIKHVGKVKGHDFYEWTWNSVAEKELGLKGKSQGCMADEIFETNPEAILVTEEGFMAINYHKLGITDMPAQK